jgi:hypothetical protein
MSSAPGSGPEPREVSASPASPPPPENTEWRLADLLDALAAEVDRAQDTVALKSFSRGLTVTVKGLHMDLAVGVRVDSARRVFFRTVEPGVVPGTILKLDLEEILQGQVEEVRKPLNGGGLPLAALPGITPEEIAALGPLSITTLDDLQPYAGAPALAAELARKSGVPEPRLRSWLGLPYLVQIDPPAGAPGQTAVLAGGNLGAVDPGNRVYFQATAAEILSWTESRITVRIPEGAGTGAVFALLGAAPTNTVPWTETSPPPIALTGLDPATGQVGATLSVVLSGSGFASGMTAAFGPGIKVGSLAVEAPSRATAKIAIAGKAEPGPRDVTLTGPAGASASTLPAGFRATAPPPPASLGIAGVVPDRAQAATTQRITISGSGFVTGLGVSFGEAIQVAVETVTAKQVTVLLTLARQARGPRDVTITNPGGQKAVFKAGFQALAPPK